MSVMTKSIKAKYSHGVIEPLEKVDFAEGEEITITVNIQKKPQSRNFLEALKNTAGGWIDLIDAEALKRNIYNDRQLSSRPDVKI